MSRNPREVDSAARCDGDALALELTLACADGLALLTQDHWNRMLSASIERAVKHHHADLVAFVLMPDRVRLVVVPRHPSTKIHRLVHMIKRTFAHWAKGELRTSNRSLFKRLTLRARPGRYTFRFWQPGPGSVSPLRSHEALAATVEAVHNSPVSMGLCDAPDKWKWSSWGQHHLAASPPDRDLPRINPPPLSLSSPAWSA